MTHDAKAEELCNLHNPHNGAGERDASWCLCTPIAKALREAASEARALALEEAAHIADEASTSRWAKIGIAASIRALASQPEETSGASAAQPPSDAVAPSKEK